MLRVIHAYNIKPGVDERSFVEWLDGRLDEITRRFGCIGRKTWVFLEGFEGTYDRPRPVRRPKYLNEAFWVGEEAANRFRQWLLSADGEEFRKRWFDSITDHTVLRYLDYGPPPATTDD
ncbi:MAG: hypothetical protein QN187_05830 [Armatimonadota bacterium]|nr:hypothetical protein [Armatimonadota bacterium]MDR7518563.1 hypothetical protein [Armatimonadota bacterium]MDR7549925.1 hypothetical protein [Armatimonadota bacterium]